MSTIDLSQFLGSTSTLNTPLNMVVVGGDMDGVTIGQGTFTMISASELTWTLDMKLGIINLADGTLDLVVPSTGNTATLTVTYTDIGSSTPVTDVVTPSFVASGSTLYLAGSTTVDVADLPPELGDTTMRYLASLGYVDVAGVSGTVTQLYANVAGFGLRVNLVPAS